MSDARFTPEEFVVFSEEFTKWQHYLGLDCYKVYFKHEKCEDSFAEIEINQCSMVATVRLNSELPDKDKPFADPKMHAKHEAIHLLIGRLEARARDRYVRSDEIYEAIEELVRRIERVTSWMLRTP
jgi:hypothetical protein